MGTHRNLRLWRLCLVATTVCGLLALGFARTATARPSVALGQDPVLAETFESLADAAERGAIDPELVRRLEAGQPTDVFAVLDGATVAEAYGNGDPRRVPAAVAALDALRRGVIAAVGGEAVETYNLVPQMLLRIADPRYALRLLNLRDVLSLTADRENVHALTRSLPLINQPQAGAMGLRGAGVAVVVLDTGADFTRPAFGSCVAPGSPAAACRVPVALDVAPDDSSMDDNGHGTNVAGIVAGVAPAASIIPIDVFNSSGTAWDHDVIKGLDWVLANRYQRNIRAVNMSIYVPDSHYVNGCGDTWLWRNPYGQPFGLLRQAGILPVIAAGNDAVVGGAFRDGIAYPACSGGGLVVGASYAGNFGAVTWTGCADSSSSTTTVTCFSQDAPGVGLLAPGALITAAGIAKGGTSQAAPHVAGAAAVLAGARPQSTATELRAYLSTTSTTLADPRTGRTHPRLDLYAALRAAVPVANDNRAAARALTTWGGQLDQVTWIASKEPGEPAHAGSPGGASVWFRWIAGQSGTAVFSTGGSDFDTVLAAYRETGGGLAQLAVNNDTAGARTSLVSFPVTAGDVVLVAVDGVRDATGLPTAGRLHLSWNLPNDSLADALPLVPNTTTIGANIGATHQPGESSHCGDPYARASVWFRWTPAIGAQTQLRAAGTQFTCVAVYRSVGGATPVPAINQLTMVAARSDDGPDPIDFTFTATPGYTYWFAVDGVSVEYACHPTTGQCYYTTPTGTFRIDVMN